MAKNEPKNPSEEKNTPANETVAKEKAAPGNEPLTAGGEAPELTAEEAAILAQEGVKALRDIGEEQLEPPAPFDIGGEHIPTPDNVIPFDKINQGLSNEQAAAQEAGQTTDKKQETETPDKAPDKKRRGRAAKDDKAGQTPTPEKEPKQEDKKPRRGRPAQAKPETGGKATGKGKAATEKAPPVPEPEKPPEPREAPRSDEQEQIVYLNLSELHAFKDHPFQVKNDEEMRAMVESVKDKGVTQAAIVRPREDGGYEIISGHRRQMASELAGFTNMPCIVRNLTDEQAITQMVEDNTTQRESILPSERAKALKMQLDAIKRQGTRADLSTSGQDGPKLANGNGNGQRSNEVVAERNKMTVKQVQRYIKLNELTPELLKMVDEKKIAFTPAVELAFIKPKNQQYIAVAIEGQQSAPSLSQAQRMRELDQKDMLNPDVIDGIMLEEKKEVDKVILSSQELGQYFGKDKTPQEMKGQIMKLLDEWAGKNKDMAKPERQAEPEK